ncbi:MAG TPA: hypothetical protein VGA61_13750, partial [Anaerolineae bacterium]
ELGIPERVVSDERLSPGFGRKKLRRILIEYGDHGKLMLVGHEPDFSQTIGRLIGDARVVIKKGGLACVAITDRDAPRGKLLQIATPEMLEMGAASGQST